MNKEQIILLQTVKRNTCEEALPLVKLLATTL